MPHNTKEKRRACTNRNYAAKREAKLAYHKTWRERNKEHLTAYWKARRAGLRGPEGRWHRYGLTNAEYTQMVIDQEGACAICDKIPHEVLRVDHDHVTGVVRALLCRKCNTGIGFLGDSVQSVTKALMYLRAHAAKGRRVVA